MGPLDYKEVTKSKFTEDTIRSILRQVESGAKRWDICLQYGISQATFYRWKRRAAKAAPAPNALQDKLRALEQENIRLKRIVADLILTNTVLKDELEKRGRGSN